MIDSNPQLAYCGIAFRRIKVSWFTLRAINYGEEETLILLM
jgi:hypothetical protein